MKEMSYETRNEILRDAAQQEQEIIEATAIAIREQPPENDVLAVIMPSVTPEQARAAWEAYVAICDAILDDDDYQTFKQDEWYTNPQTGKREKRAVTKRFKKKSAVKKLRKCWNIEVKSIECHKDDLGEGDFAFRVLARAWNAKGQVECWGGCSTLEERFDITPYRDEDDEAFAKRKRKALARAYHDVLTTAETRASNRAVMTAIGVGGAEVTAEEVDKGKQSPPPPRPPTQTRDRREEDTPENRARGIAAVHALAGELGIDTKDERGPYRSILAEDFKASSSKELTYPQLREFWRMLRVWGDTYAK